MKKLIRRNVFETNSSSSHTLSLIGEPRKVLPNKKSTSLTSEYEYVYTGEYGWGWDSLDTLSEKLSYVATSRVNCQETDYGYNITNEEEMREFILKDEVLKVIDEILQERYDKKLMIVGYKGDFDPYGYIDHQSIGEIENLIFKRYKDGERTIKECLEDYLFTDNLSVIITNDNCDDGYNVEGKKEAYEYFGNEYKTYDY